MSSKQSEGEQTKFKMYIDIFDNHRKKNKRIKNLAWALFAECKEDAYYYCAQCHPTQPKTNLDETNGVIKYKGGDTSTLRNHCTKAHTSLFEELTIKIEEHLNAIQSKEPKKRKLPPKKSVDSTSSSCASARLFKDWTLQHQRYSKKDRKQLLFEDNLVMLCVKDYLPLSLCESEQFRKTIKDIDARLNPVSRSKLSRTLLPKKKDKVAESVTKRVKSFRCVTLAFDLWMSRAYTEIFSLNAHGILKKESTFNPTHVHLGMPYSKNGTDGTNLSKVIARQVIDNGVNNMVVAYTSDGGSNLKTCQDNLDTLVSNADIFRTPKELFRQDCFAHALQGGCKSAILDCKSPESAKEVEAIVCVSETRKRMQACITWTKKSQLGGMKLTEAQLHTQVQVRKLLTPVKTRWAYLVESFKCLIRNRPAITYLYGECPGVSSRIKKRQPSWQDWEVIQMVVCAMKDITTSIKLNQACANRWLLSDAVNDLLELYVALKSDSVPEWLIVQCRNIMAKQGELEEVMTFIEHLKLSYKTLRKRIAIHLLPFLKCNIKFKKKKAHMVFALLIDPRFYRLKNLAMFHEVEGIPEQATKNLKEEYKRYMFQLIKDLKDCPQQVNVVIDSDSETEVESTDLVTEEYSTYRKLAKFAQTESNVHPLKFYSKYGNQLPLLTIFFEITFSIVPTQVENERDFSIAGIFNRVRRASMSMETLATLTFINKNLNVNEENIMEEMLDDCSVDIMEQFLVDNNEIEEIEVDDN